MIIKRERKKLETERAIIQTGKRIRSHAVEQFGRETERENGIIKDQRSNKEELS